MKEIEDKNKQKDIPCTGTEGILLKHPLYPKQSMDSIKSYQNSNGILHRNGKSNPKIYTEPQKP